MKRKHSTFTLVCSVILAAFITFEVTYIFVDNARRKEIYGITEKYQSELDGVEAKYVITDGLVKVNGEVDERRGRKVYEGDVVSYDGKEIKVIR